MYEWMNIQIYKCFNPKYTHGQLYKVQMYNVQMYNVQKDNVQKDNVLNMSAVLGVILTFFFVGAGAVQRRKRSGILSDPLENTFGSIPGPPVCPPEPIFCLF